MAKRSYKQDCTLAIGNGRLPLRDAIDSGKLDLHGSQRAFRQLFRLFELAVD